MKPLVVCLLAALGAACSSSEASRGFSADPSHRAGANPGRPADPEDFRRASPGCACESDPTMSDCRCLHCAGRPGAKCYCAQKVKESCLCGLDMPACTCVHCAGREGRTCEQCPCDHSATRAKLEAGGR